MENNQNFVKFNINSYVYIKLTEKGKAFWKMDFDKYAKFIDNYSFEDRYNDCTNIEGYTRFQCHEFMEIFGDNIFRNYFETDIYILKKDLN